MSYIWTPQALTPELFNQDYVITTLVVLLSFAEQL